MKKVVIVAPDFSPSNLPPALRIRLFARYLPEFGWEPIIISADPKHYHWPVSAETDALIPTDLRVIRTGALPYRVTRKLGFGDVGMRTLPACWSALRRLAREETLDAVLISVPPFATMLLGRMAHRFLRLPYVIDYIDPVARMPYWKMPKDERPPRWPLVWLMFRFIEPATLKRVGHVTGVSQGTNEIALPMCPHLTAADTTEIPYGGEPADFDYVRKHPRKNPIFEPNNGKLHVSYVGMFNTGMRETARVLFSAIRRGLDERPELFGRLQLNFVGTTYESPAEGKYQVLPLARECGIGHLFNEHPPRISMLDAIQVLTDSHGLLALGSDAPHYTASKIFPCILAKRPVLALYHEQSSVVQILRGTHAGQVVTYREKDPLAGRSDEVFQAIQNLLQLPPNYTPPTRWEAFEQYTARAMTRRLADALDKAVARGRQSKHTQRGSAQDI